MPTIACPIPSGKDFSDPTYWRWLGHGYRHVDAVLRAIDRRQRSGKVCLYGRNAGYAVGSTTEWAAECGLSAHQLNRVLPRVKRLAFVLSRTSLRPRPELGAHVSHRAVWLRIDHGGLPDMPAGEIDWKARRRSAPWSRPTWAKKPKPAKESKPPKKPKADRRASRLLRARIEELRIGWLEENESKPPPKPANLRKELRNRAWSAWYAQADGRWEHAAKLLVDLAALMRTATLRKWLSIADAWVLDWNAYYHPAALIGPGPAIDLDKATVIPRGKRPYREHAPGFAELFGDQREALLEAGFAPPKAA